jgi:hypothetical protein
MIKTILLVALLSPIISHADDSWKNPDFAIQVRLYRGYPPVESFTALQDLGKILVEETGNGFVMRSVVDRDDVHPGATFCIQVDPRTGSAKKELTRIIDTISQLKPEGQFVDFNVENPSSCLSKYFP